MTHAMRLRLGGDDAFDASPSTMPGRMQLTRTLSGPASTARLFVKPTTPHFAAE